MYILALETSTAQGGVAILNKKNLLSERTWIRQKSHSELLTANIEICLAESGIDLSKIDRFAVGQGPGSFTGIRVAINAAKTLGYCQKKPIFAFNTMAILRAGVERLDQPVCTLINAHKNSLYVSLFKADQNSSSDPAGAMIETLSLEQVEEKIQTPHLCIGDGFNEYVGLMSRNLKSHLLRNTQFSDYPSPYALGKLAASESLPSSSSFDWNSLQALYIRKSGAEENLGKY